MASLIPRFDMLWEILHWRVALDIALIAVGFFLLYHTLQVTGTWKIVVGVMIAVGVFAAASVLDLKGIEWIFSNLASVALLGLIIVFQPEIRRILERTASLRGAEVRTGEEELANLLAEASWALAGQRRGALLVVPGRESIQPWVSGGVELGAVPSLPLLLSLFDPHSPGHDGAAVVEHGKVSSFAVRLPLSKSGLISTAFGTRHHAALGLAEQTDALVIAVSEERGAVSLFARGRMARAHDPGEIAMRVLSHWREAGSTDLAAQYGRSRRKLMREAAVSLLAAFFFWSAVVRERAEALERVLSVPVEYTETPGTVALSGEKPSHVRVHISGPAAQLETLVATEIPVRIDLSKASAGRERILITSENLRLPKGVRLLDVDPSTVEVVLKAIQRAEVEVLPSLTGHLRKGLNLTEVEVEPKTLPALVTEGETEARTVATEPVDLGAVRDTVSLTRRVVAPPSVQPVGDRWPDVTVTVRVVSEGTPSPSPSKKR